MKIKIEEKFNLKNIYLKVIDKDTLLVRSHPLEEHELQNILKKRSTWIKKAFTRYNSLKDDHIIGKSIYLFDQEYDVKEFDVKLNNEKSYTTFYKKQLSEYIESRLDIYTSKMDVKPTQIKYRKMKRAWGNCSSKKIITLNTQLTKLPKKLIDYVLVHELAHLKYMNHSKAFHNFVYKHLEDAKVLEKDIQNYSKFL